MKLNKSAMAIALVIASSSVHAISPACNHALRTDALELEHVLHKRHQWMGETSSKVRIADRGNENYDFVIVVGWADGWTGQNAMAKGKIDRSCKITRGNLTIHETY